MEEIKIDSKIKWTDKLKPSSKNKFIQKKYINLSKQQDSISEGSFIKHIDNIDNLNNIQKEELPKKELISDNIDKKSNLILRQSKQQFLQTDLNQSEIVKPEESSIMTENYEEINNFIEEKFKNVMSENNFFLQESHSIMPFLLISNKEIHRMCLSDYDIKLAFKSYEKKSRKGRLDGYDYYKIGLITFYQGKYYTAYCQFKSAHRMRNSDPNIAKWYAFSCLVMLFCEKKIDFQKITKTLLIKENSEDQENNGFFIPCCSSRKNYKTISMQILKSELNESTNNITVSALSKELQESLPIVLNSDKHYVEGWWMQMLISIYCIQNPKQTFFQGNIDPKLCVKKIKEKNPYISYLVYAELNFLLNDKFRIEEILNELIKKFPTRIEAYLRYWQLLVKGNLKDYKKAHHLSEIFWKSSSNLNFDDHIYSVYIMITHAKSSYLIGNNFYTISFFQKEYTSNFLYPSIFYLFGKYSSKSNSKNLKTIAISSLQEVYRLLYEDLQYSTFYWLGNIFYNTGHYENCHKIWRVYIENADKSFDYSNSKLEKIKNFNAKYEFLCNSLYQLRHNINFYKKSTRILSKTEIDNFLFDLDQIKELTPNIKENFTITYEYYKGLVNLDVAKKINDSIRIFTNIINLQYDYMPAHFALWRVLKSMKEYKILLKFSLMMLKSSHSNEVNFSEWIKSYVLYAKALFLNARYEDSVELLRNLLDVFANVPLEEVKFLSEVNKNNKISLTNVFEEFEWALNFYSKHHVYMKSKTIFGLNFSRKYLKESSKENLILKEGKMIESKQNLENHLNKSSNSGIFILNQDEYEQNLEHSMEGYRSGFIIQHDNNNNVILDNNANNQGEFEFDKEMLFKDREIENLKESLESKIKQSPVTTETTTNIDINEPNKLEEYIESKIDSISIPKTNTFITIISNASILYEIGKICAKSNNKKELGKICLEDYIVLLKFQNNYKKLYDFYEKKKLKAKFWIGVINLLLKDYNNAKNIFDKISVLLDINDKPKKYLFIKRFFEFHMKYMFNSSGGQEPVFDIKLEELADL